MKYLFYFFLLLFSTSVNAQINRLPAKKIKNETIVPAFSYEDLAYRWAPIHYQDTDNSSAKSDYITSFDYDNNAIGTDNWEHLNTGNLSAKVYYSVVETSTHWFIVYAFFHPRDWTDGSFDQEHENDMEGILITVRKAGLYGTMEAMITVAHNDFYSFVPAGSSFINGNETIAGTVSFESYDGALHPKTSQEAKGHPIKAFPYISDFKGGANEDGIIYFPSKTISEIPSSGNDRSVKYKLIDIVGFGNLWTLQLFEANQIRSKAKTYAKWGNFKGDENGGCGSGVTVTCSTDGANAPWGWNDGDDGPNYAGALALDPASLVNYYFKGLGNFSLVYTNNKYLKDLKLQGYNDSFKPIGWPLQVNFSTLYAKLQ